MAAAPLSTSSDDRRNISSLLNPPVDNIDTVNNSGLPNPQLQLDPFSQHSTQVAQAQQYPGMPPIIHTGATHQSHLFPPLPPDHPMQAIIVQSAAEANSFRLTRASWGGDGPPPEGFEGALSKRKLEDGTDEVNQRSAQQGATSSQNSQVAATGPATPVSFGNFSPSKKPKGRSKAARTKAAAAGLPPSQLQYPTEPYIPQNSSHRSQPSVGLGNAIATPIPLAPPQPPTPNAPRLKWKISKQQDAEDSEEPSNADPGTSLSKSVYFRMSVPSRRPRMVRVFLAADHTPPPSFSHALLFWFTSVRLSLTIVHMLHSASRFQSADRVSVRLAARGSVGDNGSPEQSHAQSPDAHLDPDGEPSMQEHNVNGKRVLQDDGSGVIKTPGKRRKSAVIQVNAPPHTLNTYGMPMHMPMHMGMRNGDVTEMLDTAFFPGATPSNGAGQYQHYHMPPGQDQAYFRDPQQFDQSQPQAGPSQLPPPAQPYTTDVPQQQSQQHYQLAPELQYARCMSNRYRPDPFPRCVSCTRRWAGDTCRFQGIRFFLRDSERRVMGVSFVDSQTAESPSMKFPTSWNVPLQSSHIRKIKFTIAKAILPTLKAEQVHLSHPEVIRRPRETEVRATCDTCMTSIFACSWMCRVCGREACEDCARQVRDLTHPTRAMTPSGEKKMHSNPFFLSCIKRQEHAMKDFSPVSRFCKEELDTVILDMERFVQQHESGGEKEQVSPQMAPSWPAQEHGESIQEMGGPIMTTTETSSIRTSPDQQGPQLPIDPMLGQGDEYDGAKAQVSPMDQSSPMHTFMTSSIPLLHPVAARFGDPLDPASVPSLPYFVFDRSEIQEEQFQPLWAAGQALIVTGLLSSFSIHWTPEYFVQNFEQQKCLILECHTDENKSITVGEFFRQFGEYDGRSKCWKLKDWPPSTDFKSAFPELFEDFSRAVPMPNYTRRDGVFNIASHFPSNTVAPDIGPKMYNAFASTEMAGRKGSTRLHMDMADAVNIMLYSAKRPDGGEGMAAWDIFRAEDSQKIRRFLRKYFKGQYSNDPIHSQTFYLDIEMRRRLYDEFGVSSWRLYQRPGEAVFIPAGCAHQVVNLADCIKVACDFVSPQNVSRCSNLTREFREQNQSLTWKEDVLQLSAMLWFSWLNLTRVEQGLLGTPEQNVNSQRQQEEYAS